MESDSRADSETTKRLTSTGVRSPRPRPRSTTTTRTTTYEYGLRSTSQVHVRGTTRVRVHNWQGQHNTGTKRRESRRVQYAVGRHSADSALYLLPAEQTHKTTQTRYIPTVVFVISYFTTILKITHTTHYYTRYHAVIRQHRHFQFLSVSFLSFSLPFTRGLYGGLLIIICTWYKQWSSGFDERHNATEIPHFTSLLMSERGGGQVDLKFKLYFIKKKSRKDAISRCEP